MEWWGDLRGEAWLYHAFLAVLGFCAGSFASAAIYRVPRPDLSLWSPRRSFCPACGHRLRWYDNLPVLSYLLLRGRCRSCGVGYGPGYLANELLLGCLFVLAGHTWAAGGPLSLAIVLVVLTALWVATVIDWQHLILPDGITKGGVLFGFAASLLIPGLQGVHAGGAAPWWVGWTGLGPDSAPFLVAGAASLAAAAAMYLAMLGIRGLFSYVLGQEALGLGDVKFLTAAGALLGLEGAVFTLLIGVMVGAVLGVLNIVRMVIVVAGRRRRRGRRKGFVDALRTGWLLGRRIPFGPPLVLGTMFVLLAPEMPRIFFLETWPRLLREILL